MGNSQLKLLGAWKGGPEKKQVTYVCVVKTCSSEHLEEDVLVADPHEREF